MTSGQSSIVLTAGAVVLTPTQPRRVLLLRVYRNWDFPKGVVEPDETPVQTAMRELGEETGLATEQVSLPWGTVSLTTAPYRSAHAGRSVVKQACFFLLETRSVAPVVAISREHHQAAWMDIAAAQGLVVPRLAQVLVWADDQAGRPPEPSP